MILIHDNCPACHRYTTLGESGLCARCINPRTGARRPVPQHSGGLGLVSLLYLRWCAWRRGISVFHVWEFNYQVMGFYGALKGFHDTQQDTIRRMRCLYGELITKLGRAILGED